jgi:hypothetical protein
MASATSATTTNGITPGEMMQGNSFALVRRNARGCGVVRVGER